MQIVEPAGVVAIRVSFGDFGKFFRCFTEKHAAAAQQIEMGKPHVVILGAGASIASFPHGDKNGKQLPSMDNFVNVLNLSSILDKTNIEYKNKNFEDVSSCLHRRREYDAIRHKLETAVSNYFSLLEISESPCVYDLLVLSLREKDVIATFNWDPFLMQAYLRNRHRFKLPRLLFLHGNVTIGFCLVDKELGINGTACSVCGNNLKPTNVNGHRKTYQFRSLKNVPPISLPRCLARHLQYRALSAEI